MVKIKKRSKIEKGPADLAKRLKMTNKEANKPAAKSKKGKGAAVEGYCVKCKTKRPIKNGEEVTTKNNSLALKGECPECGTGMYRMMKRPDTVSQ